MIAGALVLQVAIAGEASHASSSKSDGAHLSEIDWQTSPLDLDLRGMNGERYAFHCPPGKAQPSRVEGSGPYTDRSSICSAAVHAGVIRAKDGGEVMIEIRPGQRGYVGSERNYIKAGNFNARWDGSFLVVGMSNVTPTNGATR